MKNNKWLKVHFVLFWQVIAIYHFCYHILEEIAAEA